MSKYLQIIDNILTIDECKNIIDLFEKGNSKYIDRDIAEYYRIDYTDEELSNILWERIKKNVPKIYENGNIVGLNTYIRLSKYEPGMEFGKHKDGINQDKYGNRSIFTLNIFLNDDFKGGETFFYNDDETTRNIAMPKVGRGALFDGQITHCGNLVSKKCKYLLRTDVMIKY